MPGLLCLLVALGVPQFALAYSDEICNLGIDFCGRGGRSSSQSANPTSNSRVNINPSAVPTEKGLGLETIFYMNDADFGIVRGLGRVGAAISPSNGEETFFGALSYEIDEALLERKLKAQKYEGQKLTLATAFSIYDARKTGLRRFNLNLGVLGRYNQLTHAVTPGAGVSGVFGPFTYGYSLVKDETLIDTEKYYSSPPFKIQSMIETYNLGLYLNSLILDYSTLRIQNAEVAVVDIVTLSLLVKRLILTASHRTETSSRSSYNVHTKLLQTERSKVEYFYGMQFRATPNIMFGGLYNYYLLREISVNATLFF